MRGVFCAKEIVITDLDDEVWLDDYCNEIFYMLKLFS